MIREPRACPFCSVPPDRLIAASEIAVGFRDSFPVSVGHTLVIPKKHVASIFDLPPSEQSSIWSFVAEIRQVLIERLGVRSFNIGVNDGEDAGQTIAHAHVHIIPRWAGDVEDPRGGIRWIIAEKAKYWKT